MDNELNEPLRYWGFISYSHHDRRIARWCRDILIRQRVPRKFRSLLDRSSTRLSPIFLDEESVAAAPVLTDELRTALRASQCLIVICSPFAVSSEYVAEEIRYFQSLGRADRIFCLIASGIPNAADAGQPQLECFPEPLRFRTNGASSPELVPLEHRPLGVALGDETPAEKARAVRQITAGMLGISPIALRRTELRRAVFYGVAGVIAVALLVVFLLAFVLPWKTYARDYNRRWGVWVEVDEIGSRRATLLGEHLEFVRRGWRGKPQSVRLVDGFGKCPRSGMPDVLRRSLEDGCTAVRACEAQFVYGQNGVVEKEILKDQYGNPLETLTYLGPSDALFTEARGFCSRSKSGINLVTFERYDRGSQAGLDRKISFWSATNSQREPRINDDGAFAVEYEYSPEGRVTKVSFSTAANQPQVGRKGFHSEVRTYDRTGSMVERNYLSTTGHPVIIQDGYAVLRYELDRFGRQTSITYLDLSRKPVNSADGMATIRWSLGGHGEILREEYLDPAGIATLDKQGIARVDVTYDSRGDRTRSAGFDQNGKPATNKRGVAAAVMKFDSRGNEIELTSLGPDGQPTFSTDGYVTEQRSYNDTGDLAEHSFHGPQGELVREKDGVSIVRQRFDAQHRRVAVDFFDPLGKPTLLDGYSGRRLEYDGNGNQSAEVLVGPDGQPTLNNDGWHKILYKVNDDGLTVEEHYLGLNGQEAKTNGGDYSVVNYEYDSLGREIKRSFHYANGGLAVGNAGVSGWTMRLDSRGRILEVAYLGADEKPARHTNGMFIYAKHYDDRGNLIGEEFLDAKRMRMLNNSGYAAAKYEVDRLGNVLRARYLGIGLQPTLTADGTAGWNATYDVKGHRLSWENVGLQDEPVPDKSKVVRSEMTYDDFGNVTQVQYESATGALALNDDGIAGWRSSYDDRHRETERTYIGLDRRPIPYKKDGYATWKAQYDDRGRNIETSYYDVNGRLTLRLGGYAFERRNFDDRGNMTEQAFFDDQNRPAHLWAARSTYQYNKFGWEMERRFYDAQGHLSRHPQTGRAIVRFKYDDAGRMILEESLDEHEALVDRRDLGYAKKVVNYDPSGAESDRCMKTNGKVIKPCPKE